MTHVYSLQDFHEFYERWGPSVQTYCRLFLGDDQRAEEAASTTFFNYFTEVGKVFHGIKDLPVDKLPLSLLRTVMQVTRRSWALLNPRLPSDSSFESALAALPINERNVFILQGCLELDHHQIAQATGFSQEDVQALWVRALLQLKKSWLDVRTKSRGLPISVRPRLEGA